MVCPFTFAALIQTDYATTRRMNASIVSTPLSATGSSKPVSNSYSSLISHHSSSMNMNSSSITAASSSGIPSLPPELVDPATNKAAVIDSIIITILVAIIIMMVLLCSTIAYTIYLCCSGQCPNCNDLRQQIDKWECGDLKRITTDMVKKRETLNDSLTAFNVNLEKRLSGMSRDGSQDAPAATLGQLDGKDRVPAGNKIKENFLSVNDGGVDKANGKNKRNTTLLTQTRLSNIDRDCYFILDIDLPSQHDSLSQRPQCS